MRGICFFDRSMADWKNRMPWSLLAAAVFFGFLWRLDFPKPGYDDLFYNRAAMNLAGGGDYSNPLLERQAYPAAATFFEYPPLHLLRARRLVENLWRQLCLTNRLRRFLAGYAGDLRGDDDFNLAQTRSSAGLAGMAGSTGVAFGFLAVALPPETLGVALTLTGFAVAERGQGSSGRQLAGFSLMFLKTSRARRGSHRLRARWRFARGMNCGEAQPTIPRVGKFAHSGLPGWPPPACCFW